MLPLNRVKTNFISRPSFMNILATEESDKNEFYQMKTEPDQPLYETINAFNHPSGSFTVMQSPSAAEVEVLPIVKRKTTIKLTKATMKEFKLRERDLVLPGSQDPEDPSYRDYVGGVNLDVQKSARRLQRSNSPVYEVRAESTEPREVPK